MRSTYIIYLSFIILIFINLFSPSTFCDDSEINALKQKPIKIDESDIVAEDEQQGTIDNRPVLKIAIAGMISPKYTYKYYIEIVNLIGELMGRRALLVQRRTYFEVNNMLERKELDLAFVCTGPYVAAHKKFGLEIIAVPVCDGKKVYHSYFIVKKNNGIKSFEDLKGKTFAFTDPLSNSGYIVPLYYLAKRNETPESFFRKTFFTYSHDTSIQAVADGLVDGASVDSLIYDFIQDRNPKLTSKTIIILKSEPYGMPPIVVHPSMDTAIKEKLKKILFSIHKHPQGNKALENLGIDYFAAGNDIDYETARQMMNYLNYN